MVMRCGTYSKGCPTIAMDAELRRDFGLSFMSTPWKAEVWDEDSNMSVIGSCADTLEEAKSAADYYRRNYSHPQFSIYVVGKDGTLIKR